jgi:hypothetical protein
VRRPRVDGLDAILSPRTVAIVGASMPDAIITYDRLEWLI